MKRHALGLAMFVLTVCLPAVGAEPETPEIKPAAVPSREELEKDFADQLGGATLVGHYTVGKNTSGKEERYEISEVSKAKGDVWLFKSRIVYGQHDITVPMYLEVKWAGDTPVITLTDLEIPGLGTYTARVLIYRGQYAGTWSGGDHGGQLFGRIEKNDKKAGGGAEAKDGANR